MPTLYADENFHGEVVKKLRALGYDVLTAREAGQADQGIPDAEVLAFGIRQGRAVLTHNRRHYVKLHKRTASHKGIIICTVDNDFIALAQRIHQAIVAESPLDNKLVRVNMPSIP